MTFVIGCSEDHPCPDFGILKRLDLLDAPWAEQVYRDPDFPLELLVKFDFDFEKSFYRWLGLVQNLIARCKVSMSYIELVCSFSSKPKRICNIISFYKGKWFVDFTWDDWCNFDLLYALGNDLTSFALPLDDCYDRSKDVLFFIQDTIVAFNYLDDVFNRDISEFSSFFGSKDETG
jgi:hypothetical protein